MNNRADYTRLIKQADKALEVLNSIWTSHLSRGEADNPRNPTGPCYLEIIKLNEKYKKTINGDEPEKITSAINDLSRETDQILSRYIKYHLTEAKTRNRLETSSAAAATSSEQTQKLFHKEAKIIKSLVEFPALRRVFMEVIGGTVLEDESQEKLTYMIKTKHYSTIGWEETSTVGMSPSKSVVNLGSSLTFMTNVSQRMMFTTKAVDTSAGAAAAATITITSPSHFSITSSLSSFTPSPSSGPVDRVYRAEIRNQLSRDICDLTTQLANDDKGKLLLANQTLMLNSKDSNKMYAIYQLLTSFKAFQAQIESISDQRKLTLLAKKIKVAVLKCKNDLQDSNVSLDQGAVGIVKAYFFDKRSVKLVIEGYLGNKKNLAGKMVNELAFEVETPKQRSLNA